MGDDPYIPGVNSNAGNTNVFISNFGKTGITVMVVAVGLALGLAIGAVVIAVYNGQVQRDRNEYMVEAAERRAMDRATLAEREARLAAQELIYVQAALKANGIAVPHPEPSAEAK